MRFVTSKSRVSPLKKQTIALLELLSALLLARLMDAVSEILKSEIDILAKVCLTLRYIGSGDYNDCGNPSYRTG